MKNAHFTRGLAISGTFWGTEKGIFGHDVDGYRQERAKMEEKTKLLTPIKAIRAYCVQCSGGSFTEVKLCVIPHCPLYPYRLGHRPPKDDNTEISE